MDSSTSGNNGTDWQTKVSAKKKEKSYKRQEDIFLCRAWMTTSRHKEEEEVDQSYWERIGEKYASLIQKRYVIRPKYSLLQRWSKIRAALSKFCAIYRSLSDQNQNSYSEQQMIEKVLLTYKKQKRAKFKFLHCRIELRNSLKWKSEGASKVRGKNQAQQSPIDELLNVDDDNDCPLDRQKLTKQCEGKDVGALVCSPCTEASPISAVSPVFICSSRIINFDPYDRTVTGVQTEVSEKVNTKKREKNYTEEEDVFLCRAWVAIDTDPVIGKDPISMSLWERITEAYASLIRNNHIPRTGHSLANRWTRIRSDVAKFCSIYKNITDQNLSSYTELEKIDMAVLTFQKECKERFKFLGCWNEIKHLPKWHVETTNGNKYRRTRAAMFSQQSSNGEHFCQKMVPQKRKGQDNVDTSLSDMEELFSQTHDLVRKISADQPEVEKLAADQPITSEHSSFDEDYDSPMTIDTSSEEKLDRNPPEEQQVGCREGERVNAASASPPAASSRLSALCTPVILSRDTDSNTHNHVRTDVQTEVSERVNTKKREKNYTEEEDVFLCRAWMATDADPLIKDQSAMTLWERIAEEYASLIRNDYISRTEHSLANRWTRIRGSVAKFYSIYKNITDQNLCELEKINMAVLALQKECKERFIFLSCWKELKHSPKWKFETTNGVKFRRRHAAIFSQQSSNGEHFSHNVDEDSPMPTPTFVDQSQGQKLVVRKRKAQDDDTSSSDGEELLPRRHNLAREKFSDQPEVEKLVVRKRKGLDDDTEVEEKDIVRELLVQKVRKLDELLEIEREKRDTKIMLIDPTTLPDSRRKYFEKLQQKILERVCGIPPPSN